MQEGKRFANLEDPDKHYQLLGCSKTTSDSDVARAIKRENKELTGIMVRCHPDKSRNPRDHDKYNRAHAKWNRVKRAKKVLAVPDEDGCFAARVAYDKRGEELRGLMEAAVDEIYNLPLVSRSEQINDRHNCEADYQRRK